MAYSEITAVKGIRNDVAAERFTAGDLLYGRNIDIDETGRAQRRLGSTTLQVGPAHSAWSDKSQAFYVQGGFLKRFTTGETPTNIAAVTGARVAYVDINGTTHWTDGVVSGAVTHGVNSTWGTAVPSPLHPVAGAGNLPAGTYLCTMTYVRRDGHESGAPKSSVLTLPQGGAVTFSNLSISSGSNVVSKNIYISAVNGDTPYLVGSVVNSSSYFTFSELSHQSIPVRTQFLGPPPPGQVLGYFNGRVYVAAGQYLWYSLPYEFDLFDLRTGFLAFDASVQTFAPVKDGIFLGTTKRTVFLQGSGPDDFTQEQVSPFGTIMGTEQLDIPADAIGMNELKGSQITGNAALWASAKGAVLGMDGGAVRDLTSNRFTPPIGLKTGGALLKWRDGTPQYVISLYS